MGIERTFENPLVDLGIAGKNDVEKAAKQLRKKWKLGSGPIADVVDTLENKGVYVVEVYYNEGFSGLSTMKPVLSYDNRRWECTGHELEYSGESALSHNI